MPASMFTEPYRVLVQSLIDARKAAGVSQAELGTRLGKGQKYISVIETFVRRIDVIEFIEFSRALNISPEQLFVEILERLQ